MESVHSDLKKFLQKNIFPSRTVLVFPPFNGFRRFLIHKLIEDHFASSQVAAFSIGQDISRRIVVCYKGLIRDSQNKTAPVGLTPKSANTMIEKAKQNRPQLTPTAAVYRPPAARIAESRRSTEDAPKSDTKKNRVRRPDQQMYVPRPKRASYGNDQPRSRSQSSSRTSLENDSCDQSSKYSSHESEDLRIPNSIKTINTIASEKNKQHSTLKTPSNVEVIQKCDSNKPSCSLINSSNLTKKSVSTLDNNSDQCGCDELAICNTSTQPFTNISSGVNDKDSTTKPGCEIILDKFVMKQSGALCAIESQTDDNRESESSVINKVNCERTIKSDKSVIESMEEPKGEVTVMDETSSSLEGITSSSSSSSSKSIQNDMVKTEKQVDSLKPEAMETISISSDSRETQSNSSFTTASSSEDSKSSDSSSNDPETTQRQCRHKKYEKMEVEHSCNLKKKKVPTDNRCNSQEQNIKNRRIFPSPPISDVLIISDSSSSYDGTAKESESKTEEVKIDIKKSNVQEKVTISVKKSKSVDPDDCDWESLYDDSGECLVPNLMEELTNSVGRVKVTSVDSDYRSYQTIEERTNDGECVIEIYDFPAEFKTTDLFNIFAAYRQKNFQIKWVDDTHALGVFPSPLMADEVLACTLPFVKTRPLRLGIAESRNKARNLVLPPLPSMERPKTCTALARRLVSGALGLRLPTSSQEREKEKQVLKEAREKRRLEAKQREAAWDGTLTSTNAI